MVRQKNKRRGECGYCGHKGEVTDDHIPPQAMFGKPHPPNLIKIDACQKCNSRTSKDDEYMMRFALADGAEISTDAAQVCQRVFRSLDNPNALGLRKSFSQTIKAVEVFNESGSHYFGRRLKIDHPGERLKRILEKMVRGMFFYVTKRRLPAQYEIVAHHTKQQLKFWGFVQNMQMLMGFPETVIGDNVLAYRYHIIADDPNVSVWRFEFYRAIAFIGYTIKYGNPETEFPLLVDYPDSQKPRLIIP